jgi:cytochrome c oxidase accessory protein FixG
LNSPAPAPSPRTRGPLTTLSSDGKRRWLHPVVSAGRFLRARRILGYALIALFLGLPWIPIQGKPAILLDLGARQFTFFGKTFFSHDTILLPFLALTAIVGVALFTALFGRAWCGWACPQTVYLELLFRPIESLLEGSAMMRARRWSEPFGAQRALRSAAKWLVYLVIALALAGTFVSYFTSPLVLWKGVLASPAAHGAELAAVLITAALVFTDFAWFREQTCMIACPYGRIQAALIDPSSIIVGYDSRRGEPRGKRSHTAPAALGDCVDCEACLRTCPTGIDIRDGLQLECVGCTQCVDACDEIMDRLGRPRGLVRYTSLNQLEGKPSSFLRPRVFVYMAIVGAAFAVLLLLLTGKNGFDLELSRKPGAPFTMQSDGRVANSLRMVVTNRDAVPQEVRIELAAPACASLITRDMPMLVDAHEVAPVDGLVLAPRDCFVRGRVPARLRMVPPQGPAQEREFVLLGPEGTGS